MSKKTLRPYAVEFSNSTDFIRSLNSLTFGELPAVTRAPGDDVVAFVNQASSMALAAEKVMELSPQPTLVNVLATGDADEPATPLTWLNIIESGGHSKKRDSHEWYLTVEDSEVQLTYVHGKFAYRHEYFAAWSSAFARLAVLLTGACNWHQFGNRESRRTLLGKGQFYWIDPVTGAQVPVDNFVLVLDGGFELKLEGVSHRCVLNLANAQREARTFEWCADYAVALYRAASLLSGEAPWEQFGIEGAFFPAAGTADGKFVVKSIYQYGDVHDAPTLAYVTSERQQVQLQRGESGWTIQTWNIRGDGLPVPLKTLPEALILFASLLTGCTDGSSP